MSTYVIGTHDVGNCFHGIIRVIVFRMLIVFRMFLGHRDRAS